MNPCGKKGGHRCNRRNLHIISDKVENEFFYYLLSECIAIASTRLLKLSMSSSCARLDIEFQTELDEWGWE